MDVLRCLTPQMVEKELWVFLLAYNVIHLLMAQAAREAGVHPRELSFKTYRADVDRVDHENAAGRPNSTGQVLSTHCTAYRRHRPDTSSHGLARDGQSPTRG